MSKDPVKEGKRQCLTYGSDYQNPYPPGTDSHNQFERGWSQTLKKYPHKVNLIDRKRSQENQKTQQETIIKSVLTAKAYRNAKGK